MSTDFIALFDASSDVVTAEWLLAKVASDPGFGAGVIDTYRDFWRSKTWSVEYSPRMNEPAVLLGPGGFAITVKTRTIQLYHMMPFRTFTSDPESRDALRRSCLSFAKLVGSTRAIYTHELMPYDGLGLDQIECGLREGIGPPATTFDELRAADYWGPRAWFIDTFADLRCASAI